MTKIYKFDLTVGDLQDAQKLFDKIEHLLLSDKFKEHLAKILKKELKQIQKRKLSTIHNNEDIKASTYMNSNHIEITDDSIYIYNDATIDVSTKNMSETTKANYPAQLSLAKIVEYGIGYTGSLGATGEEEDWIYDMNNHGYSGWYYYNESGQKVWTNGFTGRYVFLELKKYLEENISKIMEDFLEEWLK